MCLPATLKPYVRFDMFFTLHTHVLHVGLRLRKSQGSGEAWGGWTITFCHTPFVLRCAAAAMLAVEACRNDDPHGKNSCQSADCAAAAETHSFGTFPSQIVRQSKHFALKLNCIFFMS